MTQHPGLVELLSKCSNSFRRANQAVLDGPAKSIALAPAFAPVTSKRIRQNAAGLNKTEQAYFDHLKRYGWSHIYREPSLPLANGLRYKLDFLVVGLHGDIQGHEVKGRAYSTGIAKLKMAASLYPWITFYLVTKERGGNWSAEKVLS